MSMDLNSIKKQLMLYKMIYTNTRNGTIMSWKKIFSNGTLYLIFGRVCISLSLIEIESAPFLVFQHINLLIVYS